jgi:histone H1/5
MAATKTPVSKASGKAAAKKRKVKAASQKTAPKKMAVKKAVVKKAVAKKPAVKKTALKKAPVKKTIAKKTPAKKSAKKTAAKKPAVKKLVSKTVTRTISKRTVTRKPAATKAGAPKTLSKKAAVHKGAVPMPEAKKMTVPVPAPRVSTAARVSLRAARKSAPSKSVNANGHAPERQKAPNASPLKTRVRRPVPVIPRVKAALPASVAARVPTRAATTPRRPARSAARGLAPLPGLASDKTRVPVDEPLSEPKLHEHMRTAVLYLEAWLRNSGAEMTPAVAELEAPAEASRAQIWRWLDREAQFEDGRQITPAVLDEALALELELLRKDMQPDVYDAGLFVSAAQLFLDSVLAPNFEDFTNSVAKLLK